MNDRLYTFSTEEWLALPAHVAIDGIPIDQGYLQNFIGTTVLAGAHETATTHAFLRIPPIATVKHMRQLLPVLLRWPDGKPRGFELTAVASSEVQRVYFNSRFHCFDCGTTFPAYAISRDDYVLDGLAAPMVRYGVDAVGCPACGGPARYPGLVEIFAPEQVFK